MQEEPGLAGTASILPLWSQHHMKARCLTRCLTKQQQAAAVTHLVLVHPLTPVHLQHIVRQPLSRREAAAAAQTNSPLMEAESNSRRRRMQSPGQCTASMAAVRNTISSNDSKTRLVMTDTKLASCSSQRQPCKQPHLDVSWELARLLEQPWPMFICSYNWQV